MDSIDFSQLLLIFAALAVATNVIVEVAKTFIEFGSTARLNAFVCLVAVVLSVVVYAAYWTISGLSFAWYVFPAFIIVGILAAYAAMFGYDKLIKQFADVLED